MPWVTGISKKDNIDADVRKLDKSLLINDLPCFIHKSKAAGKLVSFMLLFFLFLTQFKLHSFFSFPLLPAFFITDNLIFLML